MDSTRRLPFQSDPAKNPSSANKNNGTTTSNLHRPATHRRRRRRRWHPKRPFIPTLGLGLLVLLLFSWPSHRPGGYLRPKRKPAERVAAKRGRTTVSLNIFIEIFSHSRAANFNVPRLTATILKISHRGFLTLITRWTHVYPKSGAVHNLLQTKMVEQKKRMEEKTVWSIRIVDLKDLTIQRENNNHAPSTLDIMTSFSLSFSICLFLFLFRDYSLPLFTGRFGKVWPVGRDQSVVNKTTEC